MSFNPQLIAQKIFAETSAGKITAVATCMTRLRITLANKELITPANIKAIEGVLGLVDTPDQLQIIIGPGKVNQVYEQFMILMQDYQAEPAPEVASNGGSSGAPDAAALKEKLKQKNSTPFKLFLKKLANIFIPMIPAFIGCGLVLGIANILNKSISPEVFGGMPFSATTIGAILLLIGNAIYYGLSLFTGWNAAKEFEGTPVLGGILAAILTMPDLGKITVFGTHAIPGRGGIIAVLLVAILGALLEKRIRKIIPVALDLFLTPGVVLLITGFLAIFIFQPLCGHISDAITAAAKVGVEHGGAVTGFVLGAFFLPLVMTGLHQGLTPIHAELIKTTGVTILLPILAMGGAGQIGSTLAVWAKTKNEKLKHIIKSGIVVGFLGVGEPLIYGVTLPLFRPFIGACIGGGFGGAFVAYFKLGATGIGISGIPLSLLIANGPLLYLCGLVISYIFGFIATWLIGFDDTIFE